MTSETTKRKRTPGFLIRDIKPGDLDYLAENLRDADKAELAAASGHNDFLSRLTLSVDLSDIVRVVEADGLPVLIYGSANMSPDTKAIWCVGTKRVRRYYRGLLQRSRGVLREWFNANPALNRLTNLTYIRNHTHHRWLKSLGADLFPAEAVGPKGASFYPFVIRREALV